MSEKTRRVIRIIRIVISVILVIVSVLFFIYCIRNSDIRRLFSSVVCVFGTIAILIQQIRLK